MAIDINVYNVANVFGLWRIGSPTCTCVRIIWRLEFWYIYMHHNVGRHNLWLRAHFSLFSTSHESEQEGFDMVSLFSEVPTDVANRKCSRINSTCKENSNILHNLHLAINC